MKSAPAAYASASCSILDPQACLSVRRPLGLNNAMPYLALPVASDKWVVTCICVTSWQSRSVQVDDALVHSSQSVMSLPVESPTDQRDQLVHMLAECSSWTLSINPDTAQSRAVLSL